MNVKRAGLVAAAVVTVAAGVAGGAAIAAASGDDDGGAAGRHGYGFPGGGGPGGPGGSGGSGGSVGPGGRGAHGGPVDGTDVTGETLSDLAAAVSAYDPDLTVEQAMQLEDGGDFLVLATGGDDERTALRVSADVQDVEELDGPPMGGGGDRDGDRGDGGAPSETEGSIV